MFPLPTSASVERPEGRNILLRGIRYMPVAFQVPLNWSHVKMALGHLLFCASEQTWVVILKKLALIAGTLLSDPWPDLLEVQIDF